MAALKQYMNYPIWAHAEFETDYDKIQELVDSLSPGDVIQINSRASPLQVTELNDSGGIVVAGKGTYEDNIYNIKKGDGRKYGTYIHTSSSKTGIGKIAVIYRADGSLGQYTVEDLQAILESEATDEHDLYIASWEDATTTVSPISSPKRGRPSIPNHQQEVDDEDDSEILGDDFKRHLRKPEMQAIGRYQAGESVDEVEGLTQDTEFDDVTEIIKNARIPTTGFNNTPYGTLFFKRESRGELRRTTIPIDSLESIEPVTLEQIQNQN